jgi:glycosyltransferase involved in cell wall biosynthesis
MPEPLSGVIVTFNAASLLEECLSSLAFADEIVVVDSGSTDNTVAIAERRGARVVRQAWLGYGPQKHFAVAQAKHDWVLCLDADERVSPELRESIQQTLAHPPLFAYRMPRRNRFLGRWLRHGEGYPDLSLRLFHRQRARWSDDAVHEKVVTAEPVGRLRGDLLHETHQTLADYLAKQNKYTSLQAQALYAQGKRASRLKLVFSPILRFVKFYLLRLGFLDGVAGFVHIAIGCANTFHKYTKLIELERQSPQN